MKRAELLQIAKPVLFNTEMVKAILKGRKTVTRRLVKFESNRNPNWTGYIKDGLTLYNGTNEPCNKPALFSVGDILYVRESWNTYCHDCVSKKMEPILGPTCQHKCGENHNGYYYKATDNSYRGWRPSIHMPKEAARIFLKVKNVRVEQLQDIDEKQALMEGVPDDTDYPISEVYCPVCHGDGLVGALSESLGYMEVECHKCDTAVKRFKHLWDSTVKKSDLAQYGWDANPWVWVIEFERIEPESEV